MQKKTGTKTLALLFCAVLIAAVSVFTTVAFLKDSDSVKNTFTVGKVAITLDEAKVDEYGTAVAGASRVQGNSYKLIPGHEYKKDPTVHFAAGSEASYLFVRVDDGIAQIEADGFGNLPVCIAKTQASLTDDSKKKGAPRGWILNVREVQLSSGAGFVVPVCGTLTLMPGLPKVPAAMRMDLLDDGRIVGLK